uniref:DUF4460 domain-containing protein n=1 Tax=Chromera velia CCMP2878 TaxID=1169474 RepID=A0A0G4G3W9_9ALVE|eukprot:Cvel_20109.t1-p1 / transcript=Cvel_20109.t1 / gene=Cvel_20109 / organism=Chromera_velia_CCMP2878 / gene_product=hypothetical protein / transcript_product=hypothetical protein / location=Cvel_scaffold1781:33774-36567(+) / protein_length=414 / sequence_SO=supercontig / SO=protein_coding / is_pseudo=false
MSQTSPPVHPGAASSLDSHTRGTLRAFSTGQAHSSSSSGSKSSSARSGRNEKGSSIRRMLRFFYREVHPDLTRSIPPEAANLNANSLAELNAYIDLLDSPLPLETPILPRNLQFFRQFVSRRGVKIPTRVQNFSVHLPGCGPDVSMEEKELMAARLIRNIQISISEDNRLLSSQAPVPLLFSGKEPLRERLQTLWEDEARNAELKAQLYGPDAKTRKRIMAKKKCYDFWTRIYTAKCQKIKTSSKRKKRLAKVHDLAMSKVVARFGDEDKRDTGAGQGRLEEKEAEQRVRQEKARLIEAGFHPDLVFLDSQVTGEQREEALFRLCGGGLQKEADVWLLENILRELRRPPTPVPIVIGPGSGEFEASLDKAFLTVPFDFQVWDFADFLEQHIDDLRRAREKRLETMNRSDSDIKW